MSDDSRISNVSDMDKAGNITLTDPAASPDGAGAGAEPRSFLGDCVGASGRPQTLSWQRMNHEHSLNTTWNNDLLTRLT